jgi:hypothetical protein
MSSIHLYEQTDELINTGSALSEPLINDNMLPLEVFMLMGAFVTMGSGIIIALALIACYMIIK